jgi:hypothetical protein
VKVFDTPGQALGIGPNGPNYFNVGLGISGNGHIDYGLSEIGNGFSKPGYFELNKDRTGARFTAHIDGGRTSKNTKYPRSELRELTSKGERAAWSADSGTHVMFADVACFRISPGKPQISLLQIHDDEDDTLQVRLEQKKLFVTVGGKEAGTLDTAYKLGSFFACRIEVSGKKVRVFHNGTKKVEKPFKGGGQYFKAGAYAQSNTDHDDEDETMVMEIRNLSVSHSK